MRNFSGGSKRRAYFEGWYFKQQNGASTVAFIPALHIDEDGGRSASVQVITDGGSFCIPFEGAALRADRRTLSVEVGGSHFSGRGLRVDLHGNGCDVKGRLSFGALTPPRGDVMGPFRFVPAMQCRHGVVSMEHTVRGILSVNGARMDFDGGTGYIEKDWGSSFPSSYLWTQCNRFDGASCAVMVSIADIPLGGGHFTGCICCVRQTDREYRLATYRGAKVVSYDAKGFLVRQGALRLAGELLEGAPHPLSAPDRGAMRRVISESAACTMRYRLYDGVTLLFDLVSDQAGFEYAAV